MTFLKLDDGNIKPDESNIIDLDEMKNIFLDSIKNDISKFIDEEITVSMSKFIDEEIKRFETALANIKGKYE
jgi:DNA primase large subunit